MCFQFVCEVTFALDDGGDVEAGSYSRQCRSRIPCFMMVSCNVVVGLSPTSTCAFLSCDVVEKTTEIERERERERERDGETERRRDLRST